MKFQKLLLLALGANLVLMGFIAASPSQDTFDRIRVHEFQLVDDRNQERASIKIEDSGEVVFRMRDGSGTIRVKIGGDADGSGFVFLDDRTNPVIHGLARKDGGKITVTDNTGKAREY
jgi:hypothetical protein